MKKHTFKTRLLGCVTAVAITLCPFSKVYAESKTAGDANGDGTVSLSDVSVALKYIAGWDVDIGNALVADVNGDGKVSLSDASIMLKYISGWDGIGFVSAGPLLDLDDVVAVDHTQWDYDDVYGFNGSEYLMSYYEKDLDSFFGVCKYYENEGYDLYSYNVMNGNHFATYLKSSNMAHVYFIDCESELNIVTSKKNGASFPASNHEVIESKCKTSVTQVRSDADNGMGYVIRLSDGSFIVYDGGGYDAASEMWNTLVDLNGGEENIIIRAWVITHAHGDHYQVFNYFANNYAKKLTLETLMISPISANDEPDDNYLNTGVLEDIKKFEGAKLLYVHTGMVFNFCDVKLEILFTPNELYIAGAKTDYPEKRISFNSSSIVSRVWKDDVSMMFLADASNFVAYRIHAYYGDYLKSDMCQAAHHGFEDFPLIVYREIKPSVIWYPTDRASYEKNERDYDVRMALKNSKYTNEIILHNLLRETRYFDEVKYCE